MIEILQDEKYSFISTEDKTFIISFNSILEKIGFTSGNNIGDGFCWGKYMIKYTKSGVKSKRVYARIYIKNESIALRLFFSNVNKHREFIENAPKHIKEVFIKDGHSDCKYCRSDKEGKCKFRKTYIKLFFRYPYISKHSLRILQRPDL